MVHKLNSYDLEIIDILKSSQKPRAYRLAQIWEQDLPSIVKVRELVKAYVKLEEDKDDYVKELVEYKIQFGDLMEY